MRVKSAHGAIFAITGDVIVGEVPNTFAPLPVSSVRAVASCAEVKEPREVAFPTDVTAPVRLAFVVTFPAVSHEAVPVRFVASPEEGVPSAHPFITGDHAVPTLTARAVPIPVPSPVIDPIAGVMVTFDTAVVSPFAFTVTCGDSVADPKVPTLLLTVASVSAVAPVASPVWVAFVTNPE